MLGVKKFYKSLAKCINFQVFKYFKISYKTMPNAYIWVLLESVGNKK